MDSREQVREVRELVDEAIKYAKKGRLGTAGAMAAGANVVFVNYVADMSHADIQTAQRMARECQRMQKIIEDNT